MSCLPSFKVLRSRLTTVTVDGRVRINNTYDELIQIIKLLLRGAAFDEKWYLSNYPDVASAVKTGSFKSGQHHFIEVGYFEGRHPGNFEVDERWYLATYPDVARGIGNGTIRSARQHFTEHGYEEGRQPKEF